MDVVFANRFGRDLGMTPPTTEADFAIGRENTWQVVAEASCPIEEGGYVYVDGTEYGGVVDGGTADTGDSMRTWEGRTWHGMLDSAVIMPPPGHTHLEVSGDANDAIRAAVEAMGVADVFAVDASPSGIEVSHRFARFATGYAGLSAMLARHGAKLAVRVEGRRPTLRALPAAREVVDSDLVRFRRTRRRPVNHLVCLGSGKDEEREVVHWYADADGAVSATRTIYGPAYRAEAYELSSESGEELAEAGREKLTEMQEGRDEVEVASIAADRYDVGDVLLCRDNSSHVAVEVTVAEKIATIRRGRESVELRA